jgi:hypothetical protein
MNAYLLISSIALWVAVLFLGFLLLGALRALGILKMTEQPYPETPIVRRRRPTLEPSFGRCSPKEV